jgi:hypothetical protein
MSGEKAHQQEHTPPATLAQPDHGQPATALCGPLTELQDAAGNQAVSQLFSTGHSKVDNQLPPHVRDGLRGSGQPLDEVTRTLMESRFGYDFGGVRIHTGPQAAESAKIMNANAYTTRSNIVFDQGQYRPTTMSGLRLLAHELTHVVQQSKATGNTTGEPDSQSSSTEINADHSAQRVALGHSAQVRTVNATPLIQRQQQPSARDLRQQLEFADVENLMILFVDSYRSTGHDQQTPFYPYRPADENETREQNRQRIIQNRQRRITHAPHFYLRSEGHEDEEVPTYQRVPTDRRHFEHRFLVRNRTRILEQFQRRVQRLAENHRWEALYWLSFEFPERHIPLPDEARSPREYTRVTTARDRLKFIIREVSSSIRVGEKTGWHEIQRTPDVRAGRRARERAGILDYRDEADREPLYRAMHVIYRKLTTITTEESLLDVVSTADDDEVVSARNWADFVSRFVISLGELRRGETPRHSYSPGDPYIAASNRSIVEAIRVWETLDSNQQRLLQDDHYWQWLLDQRIWPVALQRIRMGLEDWIEADLATTRTVLRQLRNGPRMTRLDSPSLHQEVIP